MNTAPVENPLIARREVNSLHGRVGAALWILAIVIIGISIWQRSLEYISYVVELIIFYALHFFYCLTIGQKIEAPHSNWPYSLPLRFLFWLLDVLLRLYLFFTAVVCLYGIYKVFSYGFSFKALLIAWGFLVLASLTIRALKAQWLIRKFDKSLNELRWAPGFR